jgi:hypothetical protein
MAWILGPLGAVAAMVLLMWWRVRPRRKPEPLESVRTSPWADELADRELADGGHRVEIESRRPW